MKKVSTSALAKKLGLTGKDLFNILTEKGFLSRQEEEWVLTKTGEDEGGEYHESAKYGKYIIWPETLLSDPADSSSEVKTADGNTLTARVIGFFIFGNSG